MHEYVFLSVFEAVWHAFGDLGGLNLGWVKDLKDLRSESQNRDD